MLCMVWLPGRELKQPRTEGGPELSAGWMVQLLSQLWFLQQGERHSTSRSNGKAPAISFLWGVFSFYCRVIPGLHLNLIHSLLSDVYWALSAGAPSLYNHISSVLPLSSTRNFWNQGVAYVIAYAFPVCLVFWGFLMLWSFFSNAGKEQSNDNQFWGKS